MVIAIKSSGGGSRSKKKPIACVFFLQGRCKNGRNCRWFHDTGPNITQPVCKYWLMGKNCIHGQSCRFAHIASQQSQNRMDRGSAVKLGIQLKKVKVEQRQQPHTAIDFNQRTKKTESITALNASSVGRTRKPKLQQHQKAYGPQQAGSGAGGGSDPSQIQTKASPQPQQVISRNSDSLLSSNGKTSVQSSQMKSYSSSLSTPSQQMRNASVSSDKWLPEDATSYKSFTPAPNPQTSTPTLMSQADSVIENFSIDQSMQGSQMHASVDVVWPQDVNGSAPPLNQSMRYRGGVAIPPPARMLTSTMITPAPLVIMNTTSRIGNNTSIYGQPQSKHFDHISENNHLHINKLKQGTPPPGFGGSVGSDYEKASLPSLNSEQAHLSQKHAVSSIMLRNSTGVTSNTLVHQSMPHPSQIQVGHPMNTWQSQNNSNRVSAAVALAQAQLPLQPQTSFHKRATSSLERDIMEHHDFLLKHNVTNIPPKINQCGPARRRPVEGRIHRNPRTQKLIETNMFPMIVKIQYVWVFQIMHSPYSVSDFSKQNILKRTSLWRSLQERINPAIVLAYPFIFTHVEPMFVRIQMIHQEQQQYWNGVPPGSHITLHTKEGSPVVVSFVNRVNFPEIDYEKQRLIIDRTLEDLLKNQGYNNLGGTWIQKNPREQLKKHVTNGKETFFAYRTYSKSVAKGDMGWYVLLELNFKILEKISIEEKLRQLRMKYSTEDFFQHAQQLQGSKCIVGYTFQKHTLFVNWNADENSVISLDSAQMSVKEYVEKKYNLPVQKCQHVSQEENGKLYLCQYLYRTGNSRQHKQIYTKLLEQQNAQEDKELIYRFANSLRRICDATQSSLEIRNPVTASPLYLSSIYLRFQSYRKVEICDSREFQKQWNSKVSGVLQHNRNPLLSNWCVIVEEHREGAEAVQHLSKILNSIRRKRRWKPDQLQDPRVEHISVHGNFVENLRLLRLHEQNYSIVLFVLCGGEEQQKYRKAMFSRFCGGAIFKDHHITTQFVKAENLRTGRAINVGFEVIEQMLFKTGKVLYSIRVEEELELSENTMWLSVDTCHENGLLYILVCVCCSPLSTKREDYKFYASLSHHNCAANELIPSAMTQEITHRALQWFQERTRVNPKAIVVLRDDVSASYDIHYECEIGVLRSFGIPLLYIVVVKNHSFRIFTTPISGIVVDNEPTHFNNFSFYVQHTKDSRLTKYTIVIDELEISQDTAKIRALYQLLYAMSFAYPPHKVGIKLPAICQWADHFATWLSEMVGDDVASLSDLKFIDPQRPLVLDLRNPPEFTSLNLPVQAPDSKTGQTINQAMSPEVLPSPAISGRSA